jgi:hypothetical protein
LKNKVVFYNDKNLINFFNLKLGKVPMGGWAALEKRRVRIEFRNLP